MAPDSKGITQFYVPTIRNHIWSTDRHMAHSDAIAAVTCDLPTHSPAHHSTFFLLPHTRTSYGDRSFTIYGLFVWNGLPRYRHSTDTAEHGLKTFDAARRSADVQSPCTTSCLSRSSVGSVSEGRLDPA